MKDGRIKGGREMGEGISLNKGLVFHEKYLLHDTGDHPERKERLVAIMDFFVLILGPGGGDAYNQS